MAPKKSADGTKKLAAKRSNSELLTALQAPQRSSDPPAVAGQAEGNKKKSAKIFNVDPRDLGPA
eukprot:6270924-Amphidinium_carterae.1